MPNASRTVVGDWMRYIDGSRYLSELSIPGTHDSVTALFHSAVGMKEGWTRCQDLDIEVQLQRGIRFLDIRMRYDRSVSPAVLRLCHGSSDMERDFGYVLGICQRFLTTHNFECIVMSVKNESGEDEAAFAELFETSIAKPANREFWHTGTTVPTLGEVRRKIVLLRRYNVGGLTNGARAPGIDATYWPRNCPFRHRNGDKVDFDVQDEFEVYSHFNRSRKFDGYVRQTLLDAVRDPDRRKLFINFASGTGSVWPATLAETTNPKLYDFFRNAAPGRYGIVPMDYPEQYTGGMHHDLIAAIVSTNPSDSLRDDANYELRPRLALDSRLTVLAGGRDVGISQGLLDLPWSLPGMPLLPTEAWQRWRLYNAGGGYYRLHALHDLDKALTVVGGASADGSAIALEPVNGRPDQLWKFERLPDGLLRISPKHAPQSVLDVYGAHTQNGSPVKLFHYYASSEKNNAHAQRWVMVRVG
ncbi:phosphatidylinositol-specific phospholipase C domain-containing protein [Lysobacter sp. 5GHs7-4]|uniref:phosphatidylinositol-specific phospholipase C domain-containing protein n=1 Tax=Lysobacter sp. 5GHs7-4 TaxID=2904253 RepID=UPI001E4E1EB5|nr:phosphatidylinositol-specific phospholipase C domain-containing protein [Lysobacter sp. 5GHs7-4]UHQ24446.1 phosphatidylinositol-specific phospholipase C domain-containing protein [Lysobacter sp. 5GHs7-4]